jgi:uncharacterized membrane protein
MVDDATALLMIAGMTAVTYATRIGGVMLMRLVPLTPRVEAFLRSLSSSVLVALVVPAVLRGDLAGYVAVAVSMVTMIAVRNAVGAMALGVAAAAVIRALVAL